MLQISVYAVDRQTTTADKNSVSLTVDHMQSVVMGVFDCHQAALLDPSADAVEILETSHRDSTCRHQHRSR